MNAYTTRFINESDAAELVNLYHLARVPLAGQECTRYTRMLWAAHEFHKLHSDVSATGAYKDLEGLLS